MKLEGTNINIDAFRRKGPILLSHYHRDHMGGVKPELAEGPIYCSHLTANLLIHIDKARPEDVRALECGETFSPKPGVKVTAFGSNHCDGALMFHIVTPDSSILYTGDFRLDDGIRKICEPLAGVDVLYLDNTYGRSPHYRFPTQEEAVDRVRQIVRANAEAPILIGVYTIGKEKILRGVYEELKRPIYVTPRKFRVCKLMSMDGMFTRDRKATNVRAYGRGYLEHYFKMTREYHDGSAVVIIPTGWAVDAHKADPNYHYVPYSEHCDYAELAEFVEMMRPGRVVNIA